MCNSTILKSVVTASLLAWMVSPALAQGRGRGGGRTGGVQIGVGGGQQNQQAMQQQITAEREKRALIAKSEGQRQEQINLADGERQAAILASEGEKQAAINKAQGDATAIRVIAEANAAGVRAVAEVVKQKGSDAWFTETPASLLASYDPAKDPEFIPDHAPKDAPSRRLWERGSKEFYSSAMHKTETVDYGIVLEGERVLLLDDGRYVMNPGDVVVQLGNWHGWTNPNEGSLMAFVMMGGKYEEQP